MANGNSLNNRNITSFSILSGNLNMDNTNSSGSIGVIRFQSDSMVHNAGTNNIFVGRFAGSFTAAGDQVGVGYFSLGGSNAGGQNTAVGKGTMATNLSGISNTALGWQALNFIRSGNYNTAIGYESLPTNTTGAYNTAAGGDTLMWIITGTNNTALGWGALTSTNGVVFSDSTAAGYNALDLATVGQLTAVGAFALELNTTGQFNTAVGYQALNVNQTGISNVAVGYQALEFNRTNNNNAAGYQALRVNSTGSDNLAIGTSALDANSTGIRNTTVGGASLGSLTTGSYNITLGFSSGSAYTSSESSNILIGSPGGVGESHVLRVGQQGSGNQQQNTCFVAGINSSAITGSPVYVNTSTAQLGVATVGTGRPAFTASFASNTGTVTGAGDGATGTVYNLLCTTIEFDTASNVSSIFVQTPYQPGTGSAGSTATCFTCPVTGVYTFLLQALLQPIASDNHEAIAGIYNVTAGRYIAYQIFDAATDLPADLDVTMNLSGSARCTAGNVICSFVFVLGHYVAGVPTNNLHLVGGPGQSFFSGYLVS